MKSTSRVGYDQNTKEYYYIPECSNNDERWELNNCYNDDCNNNPCNNPSEERSGDWGEHCRGCNTSNEQKPSNTDNSENNSENKSDNNSQSNCNQNCQNGNNKCGIQAWIKNAQAATPSGERIAFNIIREHQDNQCRINYDHDTDEFVFNQDGVYLAQWSINVTPSSGLGTVYLSYTLNNQGDSEVLSRVFTVYQGINGTPNILNRSSVIFNVKKNDRYSLNNASDGLINIGSINSSIGGNMSIVRIS